MNEQQPVFDQRQALKALEHGWLRLPPIHLTVTGAVTIHTGDPEFQKHVLEHLTGLKAQGESIMSQISDFASRVQANVDKLSADLTGIAQLIQTLQTSPGALTPEDQATLDALEQKVATVTGSADKLVPPVPASTGTPTQTP